MNAGDLQRGGGRRRLAEGRFALSLSQHIDGGYLQIEFILTNSPFKLNREMSCQA